MVHIQTFGYIPSLLFYLGRHFFSALRKKHPLFQCVIPDLYYCRILQQKEDSESLRTENAVACITKSREDVILFIQSLIE